MENYDRFIGQVFEKRYTVLNIIGIGGMAVVFGVYDSLTSQTVALKMLKNDLIDYSSALSQFINEAKMLAAFSHQNVVGIHRIPDEGSADRRLGRYFTMEFVESVTLKQHLAKHRILPTDEILHYTKQILRALSHIHSKEIIHGDIKPDNILLTKDGTVKLTDFGIAHHRDYPRISNSNDAIGTVYYVSPEQAEGRPFDTASDLYSLGITMYEMACGCVPFYDDDPTNVARMHIQEEVIPPTKRCKTVSPGLEEIILKAIKKNPNERFESAEAMLEAVERLETAPHTIFDFDKPPKKEFSIKSLLTRYRDGIALYWPFGRKNDSDELTARQPLSPQIAALLGVASSFALVFVISFIVILVNLFGTDDAIVTLRVPNLVGSTYTAERDKVLGDEYYNVTIVYRADAEHAFGTVLDQTPAPGTRIKINQKENELCDITLTLSTSTQELRMEDYTVLNPEEAKEALIQKGFTVIVKESYHPTIPKGLVCHTVPTAGERVRTGEEVELFVSLGEEIVTLPMPDLIGKDEGNAVAYLLSCGLLLDGVRYVRSALPAGTVIEQSVPGGTSVMVSATKVSLVVSGGPHYK